MKPTLRYFEECGYRNQGFPINLSVVLVRPLYDRNVGLVSRAMVNMGFSDLLIIDPKCPLSQEAREGAARGQEPLSQAKVLPSWQDFHQHFPVGIRWGFSTKDGQSRVTQDFWRVWSLLEKTIGQQPRWWQSQGERLFLVFGPEDWGLSNHDLEHCHQVVYLPTFGSHPSMNLSHAVLVALYSCRLALGGEVTSIRQRTLEHDLVTVDDWFCDGSFKKFLKSMNLEWEGRRVSVYTVLRQYFLRAYPTKKEKRLLQIVFEQAARRLRQNLSKT